MKIPEIKEIASKYSIAQLEKAEEAILNEKMPEIEIPGMDEGEQLTHTIAALEILRNVRDNGVAFNEALRAYTQRVRKSIS